MRTDIMFDTIEKILPDVCALFDDPDLESVKADIRNKKVTNTKDILPRIMPVFVSKHREETIRIIAAASGKAPEDVKKQDFKKTVEDMNGCGMEHMFDFFALCLRWVLKM